MNISISNHVLSDIRVHPLAHEAYSASLCFGPLVPSGLGAWTVRRNGEPFVIGGFGWLQCAEIDIPIIELPETFADDQITAFAWRDLGSGLILNHSQNRTVAACRTKLQRAAKLAALFHTNCEE